MTVFRFVREPLTDPWNFTPQAKKNPKRRFRDDPSRCGAYALSVFRSKDEAARFYRNQVEKHGTKMHTALGTHLARVDVNPADGCLSSVRGDGHRDLYESTGVVFAGAIVARLAEEAEAA